ncbi:DUF2785 domain-containing protein [Paenibacillus sp. KN14-4R]|uniref:DUF2785 domain-containing protein n=1 Tax=Paenibacillus sp. KN14-4R TaxID=3445773 RepID=UPI003F9F841E
MFGDEIGMCKKLLDSDRTEYELEAEQLKQILLHIEANGHQVPSDHNPWELAQLMMKHIGSQDATLRDKLIYSTMCRWLSPNVFTTDQMRELLHQSLDKDHLFYKLGENGTNSVFTRTFSVLIIPLVIGEHCKSPFLEKEDLALTLNCVLHYIEHERDIRGYVRGKGWAHAIAHAADAIDELAQVATITKDELSRMLVTIQNKLLNIQEVLLYQEDERLVTAIISILNQLKWSEDEINEWLKGFSEHTTRGTIEKSPEYLLNIKNVLLDLNKRIASQRAFQNVTPVIQMTIKQIYL